jgi:hypothetical protein
MSISRRDWIRTGTLAGAAALVPLADLLDTVVAEAATRPTPNDAASWFNRETYASRLNETFSVQGDGHTLRLQLVNVADLPCAAAAGTAGHSECFVLTFTGPSATPLPQDTYAFHNRSTGVFPLFLVPGGQAEGSRLYTATFNRVAG